MANRLGADLAGNVNLDAGVDAGHFVVAAELDKVVDEAPGLQIDPGVVVEKLVEARRAKGKGADGLPREACLVASRHGAYGGAKRDGSVGARGEAQATALGFGAAEAHRRDAVAPLLQTYPFQSAEAWRR